MIIEIKDFASEHLLSGVDFGHYGEANSITFVLDGVAYCASEDPMDDYRSCMGDIRVVPVEQVKNRFEPVKVLTVVTNDALVSFVDAATKEVVLEVGTEYADDYYPWFVANFFPQNMILNKDAK